VDREKRRRGVLLQDIRCWSPQRSRPCVWLPPRQRRWQQQQLQRRTTWATASAGAAAAASAATASHSMGHTAAAELDANVQYVSVHRH